MAFWNLNSNKKTATTTAVPKEEKKTNVNLLRTIVTDAMDLSQPFIDDNFSSGTNYVFFGESNLYPQILNQLYLSSPMHSACVDFKTWSVIGNGYEWKNYSKLKADEIIRLKTFERKNNFKKSLKKLTKDYIKSGRAIVLLHYNDKLKEYDSFKVVDPSEMRNSKATLFNKTQYYYFSEDWTYRKSLKKFTGYSEKNNDEWQVFEMKNDGGGSRTYGLPDWVSSANWMKVSADLGLLHKSALENGINPGLVFLYPYEMTEEENEIWAENMISKHKGAQNRERAMKIEGRGKDQLPEFRQVESSDTTTLFEQTSKEQKEEISISHNINPALMGVRIQGSLGQSEEIEFSSKQFEKIWLTDNRDIIEDFANEIISIFGLENTITINKTDVIQKAVENQGDTDSDVAAAPSDKEADARAQLRGSVGGVQGIIQIQQSVAEGLSDRGSAAALLELIYGFNKEDAQRLLGSVEEGDGVLKDGKEKGQPIKAKEADDNAPVGNDALRGLSAKENSDIYRIIRDFEKGRLNESVAKTRLLAYGIDSDTAIDILGIDKKQDEE